MYIHPQVPPEQPSLVHIPSCSPDVSGVKLGDVLVLGGMTSVTHVSAGVSWPCLSPGLVQCEHGRAGCCSTAPLLCQITARGGGPCEDSAPSGSWQQGAGAEMADVLSSSALQTAKGWLDIHSCAETLTGRKELTAWKPFLYLM